MTFESQNFAGPITLTKNVQKKFQRIFLTNSVDMFKTLYRLDGLSIIEDTQCWTKGRSSTAIAKDLRPMTTATVAEA